MSAYRSSPIKRKRRTKEEVWRLEETIIRVAMDNEPLTLRHLFYLLVSKGAIDKTEIEYGMVGQRVVRLREEGVLPWDWIVDSSRWMRKPDSYNSLSEALAKTRRTYRRALWDDQDAVVEVWSEKDAITGLIYDVTAQWDVPLIVNRGYSSASFLHDTAMNLSASGKPAFIYYLGDWDPSGCDMDRDLQARIRRYAPDADINFVRLAVTPEQIEEYDLPTRPTKKGDTRAKKFSGESVEIDALDHHVLRALVRDAIEQHVDPRALERIQEIEEQERETLDQVLMALSGDAA